MESFFIIMQSDLNGKNGLFFAKHVSSERRS